MNPLVTSLTSQERENDSQSYVKSKINLLRDGKRFENEILLKWLKRQNVFKTNQIIDNIISALIHIGRVDLAYMLKVNNLRNQCESLE
jgi:hypothetical protein